MFAALQALNQRLSTFQRQVSSLVNVTSVLSLKLMLSQTSAFQNGVE